jgi:O-antigen/teichoic acid export membrane protein
LTSSQGRTGRLRSAALSLSVVNAADMAAQFVVPVLLARWLLAQDFGAYRLLWLVTGTALAVLPMAIPNSLLYFIPRASDRAEVVCRTKHSLLYMAVIGIAAAGAVALFGPLIGLPAEHRTSASLFTGLWLFASVLDVVFSARGEGLRQARVNASFVALRLVGTLTAAWHGSLHWLLVAHVAFAAVKATHCLFGTDVLQAAPGAAGAHVKWRDQWQFALPFGISSALYMLRSRLDQWLVASLFPVAQFGVYSVGAVFNPIQGLVRAGLNSVLLPEINRRQAQEDHQGMLALNQRANVVVTLVLAPCLTFIAVTADELISSLFGKAYAPAADVTRVYMAVLLVEMVEVTTLMTALRQGRFMAAVDAAMLVSGLAVAWMGARLYGLPGAALGGLFAALIAQGTLFVRVRSMLALPWSTLQRWGDLARIVTAAMLAAFAAAACMRLSLVQSFHPPDSLASAAITVMLAAVAHVACYVLALWALGGAAIVTQALGPIWRRSRRPSDLTGGA